MSRSTSAEPREPKEVHRGHTRRRAVPCCSTCGEALVAARSGWLPCGYLKCMEKQNRLPDGFVYPD